MAAAIGIALIWWESSHPGDELPAHDLWGQYDKVVHASAWAVLAGLVAAGAASLGWMRAALPIALAIGLAYGLVDEWHQSHVPGRDADALDACADTAGSLVGACAVLLMYRRRDGDPA